jgi:uncharacterized protein YcsI (UPF0317 family)
LNKPDYLPKIDEPRDGLSVRLLCRSGAHQSHTSGMAPQYAQGNIVILPKDDAEIFMRFCQRNPKPCPLIGVSDPGQVEVPGLGEDIDIRTDLPLYRVWRDGEVVEEPVSVEHVWRQDLVTFVIGCSFTFEQALIDDGIPLRHVQLGFNVAMFKTNIAAVPAGPFSGPLVVSMRPMVPAHVIRAVQTTSRYPAVHGAPIHVGHPESIGVKDLAAPDYGDSITVKANELPVFWACGVTPQAIIEQARPAFAITHAPGCMLVTDRRNRDLAIL